MSLTIRFCLNASRICSKIELTIHPSFTTEEDFASFRLITFLDAKLQKPPHSPLVVYLTSSKANDG